MTEKPFLPWELPDICEIEELPIAPCDLLIFDYITSEARAQFEQAGVVFLPMAEKEHPSYMSQAVEFKEFLDENHPESRPLFVLSAEATRSVTVYKDITVRLGELFVNEVALPVLSTLIANYLWDRYVNQRDKVITLEVTVKSKGKRGKLVSLKYRGPAKGLPEKIKALIDA